MSQPTYRRGQAEWALWRVFRRGQAPYPTAPAKFGTRIKRLLDAARADGQKAKRGEPAYAFGDDQPEGTGTEAAFTAFDTFGLALGLDLLDLGFKQSEIVFLLRHIRDDLRARHDTIVGDHSAPLARQRLLAPSSAKLPVDKGRADPDVYLLIRKVEITEVIPERTRPKTPIFNPPEFCFGHAALHEALRTLREDRRKVIAIEIGDTARLVSHWLGKAPLRLRGRPG
jgi:hypothetical protein